MRENRLPPFAALRFLLMLAAFTVIIAGLKSAEGLLVPLLLSIFIAVICAPSMVWLAKHRVPSALAIMIIIFVILMVGFVVAALVGASLSSFSEQQLFYQQRLQEMTANMVVWLNQAGVDVPQQAIKDVFNPGVVMGLAANLLNSIGNVMTNGFLILLTVFFILAEMNVFRAKLVQVVDDPERTSRALDLFATKINRYMAIKTIVSLMTGVFITVWLFVLGVDYALLWGFLAFLLNYVPNIGSIIAAIPPVLLALVQLGPLMAVLSGLGFLLVNVIVGNVIEPRIMGKGLDLSALVVFVSLVFWGWVLGPVGMLLSVPLTMGVKIALESFEHTHWIGVLLGSGTNDS